MIEPEHDMDAIKKPDQHPQGLPPLREIPGIQRQPQSFAVPGNPNKEIILFPAQPTLLGWDAEGHEITMEAVNLFPELLYRLVRLTEEGRIYKECEDEITAELRALAAADRQRKAAAPPADTPSEPNHGRNS